MNIVTALQDLIEVIEETSRYNDSDGFQQLVREHAEGARAVLDAHQAVCETSVAPASGGVCSACKMPKQAARPVEMCQCADALAQPSPGAVRGLVAKWQKRARSNLDRTELGDGYRIAGNNIALCADELAAAGGEEQP